MASQAKGRLRAADLGILRGRLDLSESVLARSKSLALIHFDQAEAEDFCGDEVLDILWPDWLPRMNCLAPQQALADLGLRLGDRQQLLATCGVDRHVDGMDGLSICIVLYNDGLKFYQGRNRHAPVAGDWFLFDDRVAHGVQETARTTTFLCCVAPVVGIISGERK